MDSNNNKKTTVPMPQRVRDMLREIVNREDKGTGRRGVLAPLEEIAEKDVLEPRDVDYLFLNYNFSRKFLRTGKGAPYNRFHIDTRAVLDLNGEAYRDTFLAFFYAFSDMVADLHDFLAYIQATGLPEDTDDAMKEVIAMIEDQSEVFEYRGVEMDDKIATLGNENIPTYCMSKASLLEYMHQALDVIYLYQDMFEILASRLEMPRLWDGEEDGKGADVGPLARFCHKGELPS